ncbi:MAG: NAD(P)H-binding protein [Burkholderiales bacterium]|nr:NAD(P)H-binding protein [Burkholderiales bacterium]
MKRLFIVGFGDIARRALPYLDGKFQVAALARTAARAAELAARGVVATAGDLDVPESLRGLACEADCLLHAAPPAGRGSSDLRTRNLLEALSRAGKSGAMLPQRVVYLGTSGVYGDCGGERIDESRALNPQSDRARRRADAEAALGAWCAHNGVSLALLRAPGIYAADRLPLARLRAGAPALRESEDVYTNHVHADDLARIAVRALEREYARGPFNACDDTELKAGDWFDRVADCAGLPRPQRLARGEFAARASPEQRSFLRESRRLSNRRMKEVLGVRLVYPTVQEGLAQARVPA